MISKGFFHFPPGFSYDFPINGCSIFPFSNNLPMTTQWFVQWFLMIPHGFSKNYSCQPWINKPLGGLIGGIPFKYQINYDYLVSTPLINKPWFMKIRGWHYPMVVVPWFPKDLSIFWMVPTVFPTEITMSIAPCDRSCCGSASRPAPSPPWPTSPSERWPSRVPFFQHIGRGPRRRQVVYGGWRDC